MSPNASKAETAECPLCDGVGRISTKTGTPVSLAEIPSDDGGWNDATAANLARSAQLRATPSSCPAWALVAWLMDRREQYKPSSGTYSAFDGLIAAIADGEHVEAWKHGETDDLRGAAENCIAKRPASPFTSLAPNKEKP